MHYWGEFRSIHDNIKYRVDFFDEDSENTYGDEIILGDTPCVITTQSSGLFDPIKPSTCTIQVYTKEFLPDLYSSSPHGVHVKVTRDPNNAEWVMFHGYVTPCMYTMGYTYADIVEIECIDAISSLQYIQYTYLNGHSAQNLSMLSILKRALNLAGYEGSLNWMKSLTPSIDIIQVNEGNFFDDDDNHTPWSWYEVVEEICKFLGWSFCPYGDNVYLNDYRYLSRITQNTGSSPFQYYSIYPYGQQTPGNSTAWGYYLDWSIGNLPYAAGSPSLSLDEVYSKIEVSANTYNIDKIIPKVDNMADHISINKEQGEFDYVAENVGTGTHKNWFLGKKYTTYNGMPGFWSAYCRLNEDRNWKHHFWNIRDITTNQEITGQEFNYKYDSYRDPRAGLISNPYVTNPANKMINTMCAVPCHYSFDSTTGTSVSWSDCLMVLKYSAQSNLTNRNQFRSKELHASKLPLLTYENDDTLIYKPASGTTWITIKCELFYQRDQMEEDNGNHVFLVSDTTNKVYATVPFDGEVKVGEHTFKSQHLFEFTTSFDRTPSDSHYKEGYRLVPMRVQLGDYWWNGSTWVPNSGYDEADRIFYLYHTNDPDPNASSDDDKNEYIPTLKWMKIVPNTTYKDKVGEEAYAIPIDDEHNAPSGGKLKIELCTPRFLPVEWEDDTYGTRWQTLTPRMENRPMSWTELGPCIYMKGYEVNLVYTDESVWWLDQADNDTDIVYSHKVSPSFCHELNTIELKINTAVEEKPISKSFITNGSSYIKTVKHIYGDTTKTQEKNLIDMYYEHYSKPTKIYTIYSNQYLSPYHKLTFGNTLSGTFVVDSQVYDVRNENVETKVIQYESDLE